MKKIKVALLGCGDRGCIYADYSLRNPDDMEIVAVVDTSELKKHNLAVCGGEALTELVAHLKINGRDAYQDMMCVRYAGRWYNLDAGGMVTNSFNVYPTRANLWIPDEKELEEISRRMAAE